MAQKREDTDQRAAENKHRSENPEVEEKAKTRMAQKRKFEDFLSNERAKKKSKAVNFRKCFKRKSSEKTCA